MTEKVTVIHGEKISLHRVLGPAHVWALGVGIVLVEFCRR
jgi:ethanolamine permease